MFICTHIPTVCITSPCRLNGEVEKISCYYAIIAHLKKIKLNKYTIFWLKLYANLGNSFQQSCNKQAN